MADALGHRSYVQISAAETTYGTAMTGNYQKLGLMSCGIKPVISTFEDPELYASPSPRAMLQGPIWYRGPIVLRGNYEGHLRWWQGVMGTGAVANAPGETTVKDITFKEASTLSSYTIEVSKGDLPANQVERYLGCTILGVKVSGKADAGPGSMVRYEFDVHAKDMLTGQTPATPTALPSILPIMNWQANPLLTPAGAVDDGTADVFADVRVTDWEVSITNNMNVSRLYTGSQTPDQPLRDAFLQVVWRITKKYKTKTLADAARAFTVGSPQLIFNASGTNIGVVPSNRQFEIRSNKAQVTDLDPPVAGYGELEQTVEWTAFNDTVDASASVVRYRSLETAI